MKLIKLILSDSAYKNALAAAGIHAVPVEAYISSELEDLLDKRAQLKQEIPTTLYSQPPFRANNLAPSFKPIMPDTLEQVLEVCKYVYRSRTVPRDERYARELFLDALNFVAKETVNAQTRVKGVGVTTVRDKCTTDRRLGLPGVHVDTMWFVSSLCRPELLRDHLSRKFPRFLEEIHRRFLEWLPGKFPTN